MVHLGKNAIGVLPIRVDADSSDDITITVSDEPTYLCRTKTEFDLETSHKSFERVMRLQFPVTLSYGSTSDSCVGVTADRIMCEGRKSFFAHG